MHVSKRSPTPCPCPCPLGHRGLPAARWHLRVGVAGGGRKAAPQTPTETRSLASVPGEGPHWTTRPRRHTRWSGGEGRAASPQGSPTPRPTLPTSASRVAHHYRPEGSTTASAAAPPFSPPSSAGGTRGSSPFAGGLVGPAGHGTYTYISTTDSARANKADFAYQKIQATSPKRSTDPVGPNAPAIRAVFKSEGHLGASGHLVGVIRTVAFDAILTQGMYHHQRGI